MTFDSNTVDAAIVGGGMVGLSLAVALAQSGISATVIEKGKLSAQLDKSFDGRVSAIALGSKNLLEALGVWNEMKAEAQPILDIRVSDGHTPFFLHYKHEEVSDQPFGYIVENRFIRHALHNAAAKLKNLHLLDQTDLRGFESDQGGHTLQFKNGKQLRCKLLVGADGKNSHVRTMAGIGAIEWKYRQSAIVCTIGHHKPHHGLAQERFLPIGPFAVLPMTGHRSSLVWVEPADRVGMYMELSDEEFVQEIRERAGNYLGSIRLEGQRFCYPLALSHAKSYIGHRLALIGDAAHSIHPLAGQGVNLGFRDTAVLHEVMTDRLKLGLDIASQEVLRHYQQWRRFDNVAMMAVTDGLNRLFSNNLLPVRLARGLGLWGIGKAPPLKRFFMRHAMGLMGDVPRLIRPRPNC